MDLEELKRILEKDKGKIIIVENGKPLMIITAYGDPGLTANPEDVQDALEEEGFEPAPGELTIDDLPL